MHRANMLGQNTAESNSMRLSTILLALLSCCPATDVDRQAKLTTCELIRDFGYSCETFKATTDDGYVLEVDRVGAKDLDNGITSVYRGTRGRPILLVPGILVESGLWFMNFPAQSPGVPHDLWPFPSPREAHALAGVARAMSIMRLTPRDPWHATFFTWPALITPVHCSYRGGDKAMTWYMCDPVKHTIDAALARAGGFLLADAGYDVWAMNPREIAFRTSHLWLKEDDASYWQWSFDEIGRYDIAGVIDLVLNATGVAKLPLLVFSQGFVSSLVLLSTRPEYNEKVEFLLAYGPVANVTYVGSPIAELLDIMDVLFPLLDPLGHGGYVDLNGAPAGVLQLICEILQGQPCSLLLAITMLTSPVELNNTRTPVMLSHFPIGSSYRNFEHYVQLYKAKNFVMYDYGPAENRGRYGQEEPPAYPLENICVPMALFSSTGDILADPDDVAGLVKRLGARVLFNQVVPPDDFAHLDFLSGYQAAEFLHQPMIDTLASRAQRG